MIACSITEAPFAGFSLPRYGMRLAVIENYPITQVKNRYAQHTILIQVQQSQIMILESSRNLLASSSVIQEYSHSILKIAAILERKAGKMLKVLTVPLFPVNLYEYEANPPHYNPDTRCRN